jgi:hypothetical protein
MAQGDNFGDFAHLIVAFSRVDTIPDLIATGTITEEFILLLLYITEQEELLRHLCGNISHISKLATATF